MNELQLAPPPIVAGLEIYRSLELKQAGHVEVTTVQGVASTDFVHRKVDVRRVELVDPEPAGCTSRITFEKALRSFAPSNTVHGEWLRILPTQASSRTLGYEGRTYIATSGGSRVSLELADRGAPPTESPPEVDVRLYHGVDLLHPDVAASHTARTELGSMLQAFLFRELTGGVVADVIIGYRFSDPVLQGPTTPDGGVSLVYMFNLDATGDVAAGRATIEGAGRLVFRSDRLPTEFFFRGRYVTTGGGLSHEQAGRGEVELRVSWTFAVPE